MDPLTALSLACNILQVIDIALKVVSEAHTIAKASDGLSDENRDVFEITTDIKHLTLSLTEKDKAWQIQHAGSAYDENEQALQRICTDCQNHAEELIQRLEKLRPREKGLASIRAALQVVWRREEIRRYQDRLQAYRDEIHVRISIGIRHDLVAIDFRNDERFNSLALQLQQLSNGQNRANTLLEGLVFAGQPAEFPLHKAAERADLQAIRELLLSSDVNVNGRNRQGQTPLHLSRNAKVAGRLLDDGANANAEDRDGATPLHLAIVDRRLDVVDLLLTRGANKHKEDGMERTPMHLASDCPAAMFMLQHGPGPEAVIKDFRHNTGLIHMAWIGDMEGLRFYISQGAEIDKQNDDGRTALLEACRQGDLEATILLLDNGADMEYVRSDASRPLSEAVRFNRVSVVQELLSRGASMDERNSSGTSTICEASCHGQWETVKILAQNGAKLHSQDGHGNTPLHHAVRSGDVDIVKFLIQKQSSLNTRCYNGQTPLYGACDPSVPSYLEKAEALLEAGADASIPCKNGYSPLSICARDNNIHMAEILLRHNVDPSRAADPSRRGAWSWTPLAEASFHSNEQIVRLLLEHGADPNIKNESLHSALHMALEGDDTSVQIVRALVDHRVDLEARDLDGRTPLHMACDRDDVAVVRLLLDSGADATKTVGRGDFAGLTPLMICARSRRSTPAVLDLLLQRAPGTLNVRSKMTGRTALWYSIDEHREDSCQVLLRKGADTNVSENTGRTALHRAAEQGSVALVKALLSHGANSRIRDGLGLTAWRLAQIEGKDHLLRDILRPSPP